MYPTLNKMACEGGGGSCHYPRASGMADEEFCIKRCGKGLRRDSYCIPTISQTRRDATE